MNITKGTIIRTLVLVIALINMILRYFGVHPLDISENSIARFVEVAVELLAILSAWWYNNSFTPCARKADEFMKKLKDHPEDV